MYVAVIKKRPSFAETVCRKYGVGVLVWSESKGVIETVKPDFNSCPEPLVLKAYMKESVAGSPNDRVTAFKNTVNEIVAYLEKNDGDSVTNVLNAVEHHWKSAGVARASIEKWCRAKVIKDFRFENKRLYLR